jgi:hypothetical protein
MHNCSFCDRLADSREHVIPKWLQRQFSLSERRLALWNQTSLPYRQTTIPACRHCNNERFSRLEDLVQSREANDQELYLWALKIRYGLSLKDGSLPFDRRSPAQGPLLSPDVATFGEQFIRHAFLALDGPKFRFDPFPFGSVFQFIHEPSEPDPFDFVDVPPPLWALAISLSSRRTLAVLFADRGITKRVMHRYAPLKAKLENVPLELPGVSARHMLFQALLWQLLLILPSGVRLEDSGIRSERIPAKIRTRDVMIEDCYRIANHCGLPTLFAEEAFVRAKALRERYPFFRHR